MMLTNMKALAFELTYSRSNKKICIIKIFGPIAERIFLRFFGNEGGGETGGQN